MVDQCVNLICTNPRHNICIRRIQQRVIPTFHLYITEINSEHRSSFLSSLKVELMLLLAILNRSDGVFSCFLMFANN